MAIKRRGMSEEPQVAAEEFRDTIAMDAPPARKKAPASRLLLLLLLLVVVAGAAYYYLIGLPEEEPAPPPLQASAPIKQTIALPVPEKPPVPVPAAPAAAPAQTAPATAPAQVAAPTLPATAAKPAGIAPPPPAPLPGAVDQAAGRPAIAPAVSANGKYLLEAGTFLVADNRVQVEKIIRRLGFEPKATPVTRTLEMVRLRVGVFSPEEAKERLREVRAVAPDAFTLPQGDQVAVYAASFYDLDQARIFADSIFGRGVRVEEEMAKVPMTLRRLTFGSFSDQAAADQAAAKARKAGLQVAVARRK